MRTGFSLMLGLAALFVLLASTSTIGAADFAVDTTDDAVDASLGDGVCATAAGTCSLRAAVQEANATPGPDLITVPSGTYTLTLAGAGEQEAATGDLDIHDDLTITGAGRDETIIDGGGIDRVFQAGVGQQDPLTLTLQDLTIQNGFAADTADGGGVDVGRGIVTIERVAFLNNEATAEGGGLDVDGLGGALTIRDSLFDGNTAGRAGGGFFSAVGTTVEASLIINNAAASAGGVRVNDAVLTITDSTVANNAADNGTGGIGIFRSGALLATNVTVSGNDSGGPGQGAGIAVPGDASVLTHVTIVNNGPGFGIGQASNTITIRGSIVANNAQQDCAQARLTVIAEAANLDSDGTCGFSLTGDPLLSDLADWGGPEGTLTHALEEGSPAFDTAASCLTSLDQRGAPRPLSAACDLGALEAYAVPARTIDLQPGFSTLGWTGGTRSPETIFGLLADSIEGVWAWDDATQQFLTWRPEAPVFLNSLREIVFGMGLWILVGETPIQFDIPGRPIEVFPAINLTGGFNLVTWTRIECDWEVDPCRAPSLFRAADEFARLGEGLNGAWFWDAASVSFLTFFPNAPAVLNNFNTLAFGDVFWVSVAADVEWAKETPFMD